MMEKLRSYVPELLFGEQKQETPSRICHEDFVVIDPSDRYRILTGRGLYAQGTLRAEWIFVPEGVADSARGD